VRLRKYDFSAAPARSKTPAATMARWAASIAERTWRIAEVATLPQADESVWLMTEAPDNAELDMEGSALIA
jgi:hypothetical protein